MNDELEQPGENQDQLEQSNRNQDQLIEIYKLHAQLASDISNRLTTTNRFYPTLMSGLLAIFFAVLQRADVLFPQDTENKEYLIGFSIVAVGYFGAALSVIWFFSIRYYYRMISKKHEVLLELEAKLEFPFFEKEWGGTENTPYSRLSRFETFIPYAFTLVFFGLIGFGIRKIGLFA